MIKVSLILLQALNYLFELGEVVVAVSLHMCHFIFVLRDHFLSLVQVIGYLVVSFHFIAHLLRVLAEPQGTHGLLSLPHGRSDTENNGSPGITA